MTEDSRPQKYAKLNGSGEEEVCYFTRPERPDNNDQMKGTRAASPLFSEPSSPDVPLISNSFSSVPEADMSVAANAPSSAIKVSRHLNNPHTRIAEISPSEFITGGGISIKQRLGIGALAPTNPRTGPPPPSKQASKPLSISHPSALASLKIKKMTPSLSITTDINPASGTHTWREPPGSAYDASMHSPQITANVSPNTANLMPSTPVPVSTPTFHRPSIPHGTMYVFLFNLIVYFTFLLLVRLL